MSSSNYKSGFSRGASGKSPSTPHKPGNHFFSAKSGTQKKHENRESWAGYGDGKKSRK